MKHVHRLVLMALMLPALAHADDPADVAKARDYYRSATDSFRAGRYTEAQAAFAAGYELSHRPGFLWNMAECARLSNQPARAVELYKKYLASTPADAPQRADAEQRIRELESTTPATTPAPPIPIPAPTTPTPPPVASTPDVASARTAPEASRAARTPNPVFAPVPEKTEGSKPITSKWWFWGATVGVVAAVAIGTALVATHSSSSGSTPPPSSNFAVNWR